MKVILISGHAGHGKDTVANILQEQLQEGGYRVLVTHYADLLKYICRTYFGWNGKKDAKGRELLQYIGTDVIKKRFPDFWVDFIKVILQCFDEYWDFVIIPDARFPNELSKLRNSGFNTIHLRVIRPNYESRLTEQQKEHQSETALDASSPDYRIYNNGNMEELKKSVKGFLKGGLYEKKQ